MVVVKRTVIAFIFMLKIDLTYSEGDSLSERAARTYEKIIPCLKNNKMVHDFNASSFKFPDDAEAHYKELLEKTIPHRVVPVHDWASFHGPWIENHFIQHFMSKPLSYFNGLIPLFVQWVDIHVYEFTSEHKNKSIPDHRVLHNEFSSLSLIHI